MLMDPSFLTKLGIEMSIGGQSASQLHTQPASRFLHTHNETLCCSCLLTAAAQTLAEWERRRQRLWVELDFAFADIITW